MMIIQKLLYANLMLKKHFFLLLMFQTDVLLNIFVETVIHFLGFFDE